jgi:hypothetical protein
MALAKAARGIEENGAVRVLLAGATGVDPTAPADAVRASLAGVGARDVAVSVELVGGSPRTALGKAPLIRRAQPAGAGH